MATENILSVGVRGVDALADPLTLGTTKLHSGVNIRIREGVVTTRPGFRYHRLGVSGQFQGIAHFNPAFGISANSFSPSQSAFAVAAGGEVFLVPTTGGVIQPCSTS